MGTRYVALLRGINVGGKNPIKMSALKSCFEEQDFRDVVTYIASGNVLLTADRDGGRAAELARRIEAVLAKTFGYRAHIVLRSRKQMQTVVRRAPAGFGSKSARYRYDVMFLRAPLTAASAMKVIAPLLNPDVDEAHGGKGVLYFSRLIAKASLSRLSRIIALPIYQNMTIRNWNTTTALLRMMESTDRD
jgi:uncharacterized protein (DUF1697 family)